MSLEVLGLSFTYVVWLMIFLPSLMIIPGFLMIIRMPDSPVFSFDDDSAVKNPYSRITEANPHKKSHSPKRKWQSLHSTYFFLLNKNQPIPANKIAPTPNAKYEIIDVFSSSTSGSSVVSSLTCSFFL